MKSETVKLKVDGEEKEYSFNPLAWEDFPKLYSLMGKFGTIKEGQSTEEFMKVLDENTMKSLMDLEYKMFKKSYPEMTEDTVKNIIKQNIFQLLSPLMNVNVPK